jgi:HPr kinase/phosphorylase
MTESQNPSPIRISRLLEIDEEQGFPIGFTVVAGGDGLTNEIASEEFNRPGLPLAGFFEEFSPKRIQILGKGEMAYIARAVEEGNTANIDRFLDHDIPVCVVTYDLFVPQYVLDACSRRSIPLLRTRLSSKRFISLITMILSDVFAPYITMHADYVSIHNIGVLITGQSGIGKSESVLGLVERGHKFICDDIVRIKKVRAAKGFELIGEPYVNYGPFIEIRGIGIINVSQYFGEGRILGQEKLGLIIELHEWDQSYNYDRVGIEETYRQVMGIDVPVKQIPVSSGRNIPLLIEVAAYREIMRRLGYNSAEDLDRKIITMMRQERKQND